MSARGAAIDEPPHWPPRGAVCLDCRTVYDSGRSECAGGHTHRVRDMRRAGEREELVTEVWGPPSRRRRARELGKAGAAGGGAGGALEACGEGASGCGDIGSCDAGAGGGEVIAIVLAVIVAVGVAIALYWLIKKLVEYIQARRARLKPKGALLPPPRLGRATGRTGVIRAAATLPSPVTATPCAAYGAVFAAKRWWKRKVMLRDAATLGFDVELDSGERVRIPPGTIALDMRGADSRTVDAAAMFEYVRSVDPDPPRDDDHSPFQWNEARERTLTRGDRVEVRGVLRPVPDPDAPAAGYRDAPPVVLVPDGLPRLALVRDGD